jgi:hypothetical protein
MHAAAEARAYYRQPSREYDDPEREALLAALMDAAMTELVDAICPPQPGRPKGGAA